MPIDTSIYGRLVPQESMSDLAMKMSQMSSQRISQQQAMQQMAEEQRARQEKEQLRAALAGSIGPDGQVDRGKYMSALARINPQEMLKGQEQFRLMDKSAAEQKAAEKKAQAEDFDSAVKRFGVMGDAAEALAGMPPEQRMAAFPQVRAQLIQMRVVEPDKIPEQYDEGWFRNTYAMVRSTKAHLEKQNLLANIDQSKASTAKNYADADKARREKATPKGQFERLPEEDQIAVKDLAKSNASKITIANQIEAVLNKANGLDDAQRLQQYRQIIKTLNSTQGQDAVGAEEAKRLASKLEIGMGGLVSGNLGQFGRDLDGFEEDAKITVDGLRSAVAANEKEIGNRYASSGVQKNMRPQPAPLYTGKKPSREGVALAGERGPEDRAAIQWAEANPNDPRAKEILKLHGRN
jgi:hypothetical protein